MARARNIANSLLVTLLCAAGPMAFAAWVARPPVVASPNLLPVVGAPALLEVSPAAPVLTQRGELAPASGLSIAQATVTPRSIATLYTSGRVNVQDSSGERRSVESGGYAYLGGEFVVVPSGGLGVLRAGGMSIFLCGGVRASLAQQNGRPVLELRSGAVRAVSSGPGITVKAGDATVTSEAGDGGVASFEVSAKPGRLVVLQLGGDTLASTGGGDGAEVKSAVNQIIDGAVRELDWPASLPTPSEWRGSPPPEVLLTGGDYLCRSEELASIARTGRASEAIDVSPIQVINLGAPPGPAGASPGQPDASNGFDPNALPPPAAGPDSAVIVVAAPAAPVSGTGGGAVATPE
ncbi:MAG: hypothetical protein AAF458_20960 [Pseudomonadota bacterium]